MLLSRQIHEILHIAGSCKTHPRLIFKRIAFQQRSGYSTPSICVFLPTQSRPFRRTFSSFNGCEIPVATSTAGHPQEIAAVTSDCFTEKPYWAV